MSKSDIDPHWTEDAKVVIQDMKKHVRDISISNLPSTNSRVYFNITTLELKDFCAELSAAGFTIVGEKYDSEDKRGKYSFYETPYSMLDNLSPAYRDSFGEQLMIKLTKLQEERANKDDESES